MTNTVSGALLCTIRTRARTPLSNRAPAPIAGRFSSQRGVPLMDDPLTAMDAFASVGTLFAIVSRISVAVALTEWSLYRKLPNGEREEVQSHPALMAWNKPTPDMTHFEFIEASQQHLDLTGEMWWLVGRAKVLDGKGPPLELWPVRPDRMRPVPSTEGTITGYFYRSPDGEEVPLRRNEVIFTKMPNPLDPYRGMGPVQTVMVDIDSERYSAQWNANFFKNNAEPGGIVEIEKKLDDDEFDELVERWREQHQGVGNAHRVAFLEHGKWVDRKYTNRDMQFAELRNVNREVIREAFAFPKPLLGATDDVNRANAEAADVTFARWLVDPRLKRIKETLNERYLPMFGIAGQGLEFDYMDPVPEDREYTRRDITTKVDAVDRLVRLGFNPAATMAAFDLPQIQFDGLTMAPRVSTEELE